MLDEILRRAENGEELSREQISFLLEQTEEESVQKIFTAARNVRNKHFGNKVFLYGFVYFSTYCKNNCSFCFFRAANGKPPRYRKQFDEIIQTAKELADSGVHLIDLTMGEDPYYIDHPERLVELVKAVKKETGLPVMVSPGLVPDSIIDRLANAGADWYALYQETHNKELFSKLRLNQRYDERFHAKVHARERGMLVEEGLLTGVGSSVSDTVHSFEMMEELEASQVRTMTFIPQDGIPLQGTVDSRFLSELLNIAVMRLLFPGKLIPASLDVDGLNGLAARLNAGANVVTSIIPPQEGYAGVANAVHDINEGYRTVAGIGETLKACGVEKATAQDYIAWVNDEKHLLEDEEDQMMESI